MANPTLGQPLKKKKTQTYFGANLKNKNKYIYK